MMGESVVGNPLWAVLIPPQLAHFRTLVELGDAPLAVDFTGWNKYVLLSDSRAFLFPRRADNVEWFERELTAYRALEPTGLAVIPRLGGEWWEDTIYPFPFAAVTRLHGVRPTDASVVVAQLGRAIAQWHDLTPPELPGARLPAHHDRPDMRWLHRALNPATARDAAAEAADRLGHPEQLARWTERLEVGARHQHVLVHGDIHEDQLLVVEGELTGILDWETVRIDHPFWDFDLGEWGTGLWRRHRHDLSRLWSIAWRSYARERGLAIDAKPLETAFRLRQALYLLDNDREPSIVGTVDEHLRGA
jgi:aminoglycoside phosphotransferase (APT) family kinase protein